jgi:hypothetical protein
MMTEPNTEEPTVSPPPPSAPLSKNALKRQLKRQRWEDSKSERRANKKAKLKQKRESQKLAGILPIRRPPLPQQTPSDIRIVIDCGFDELMIDKVSNVPGLMVGNCEYGVAVDEMSCGKSTGVETC